MNQFVYFNGSIVAAEDPEIPLNSFAALYGKGVFTTLLIKNGFPVLLGRHWERLTANAAFVGVECTAVSLSSIAEALSALTDLNKFDDAKARITIFDLSSPPQWNYAKSASPAILVQTAEIAPAREPFELTISIFPRNSGSPLAAVKSCNYLENILAHSHAVESGFEEAVRLNEFGEVTSACFANIFWIKNEKLFTPAIETGCLPGIMRGYVIDAVQNAGFRVQTVRSPLEELLSADEIFLTSSIKQVAVVKSIDQRLFGSEIGDKVRTFVTNELRSIPT